MPLTEPGLEPFYRLVCQNCGKRASTAKAARLIGGHTVHSAFKLRKTGGFLRAALDAEQHSAHWTWLYTRDIIVIDELSMLTAGSLHAVNEALNYVTSLNASTSSRPQFGCKSVVAVRALPARTAHVRARSRRMACPWPQVGDLFQLPAVEKYRMRDQVLLHAYPVACVPPLRAH